MFMKVASISVPKTSYKPGESVVATVTVKREIEGGGVVYFYVRRSGQVWQAGPVVTVGSAGLALPDIFASGQLQKVTATISLPSDAVGNYQIGAREQSESTIGVQGVASFSVEAAVPTPAITQTTVTFMPNRSDASDVVLYVDGSPFGILPAWGFVAMLKPGKHTVSAAGSVYSASEFTVTLTGGTTVKIPVQLLLNSEVKKAAAVTASGPAFQFGANPQTYALIGVAAAVGLGIVFFATRRN